MHSQLLIGYEKEIRCYRLAFSRGCAYTAIVLILLGSGLDYALYPHRQVLFFEARVVISALIFAIIMLMRTKWGRAWALELSFLWLLLPQIMITWMIGVTDGANSQYYSALHLAIFASGLALPFTLWQNVSFGALSFAMYVAACATHPESFTAKGAFIVNSLFLFMSATISAVCTYFNELARFMLFKLKVSQLEATNKALSEIKGQMLQQEKMAAIGTLTAGLLHEINNPVNFCMMAIDVAGEQPEARNSPILADCLNDAKQGMERVHHIVSDLKTFAYRNAGSELEGTHFLLEEALDTGVRLVGHEIKGVRVTRELPGDTLVRGDEAAVIGVLINLLGNAALAGRKVARSKFVIAISARWEADRLRVSVQDNGAGISPENLKRVFEPFFTTREVGHGLGLGLSISYGVIQRHGGTLMVESVAGEWTRFVFDLPRGH